MDSTSDTGVLTASPTPILGNGGEADDDVLRVALNSISTSVSAISGSSTETRQNYESRLRSFQASTYCAKPACLSPLLCARFGWRNADRDILSCNSCKAALAITWPSGLSAKAMEGICSEYRHQLSSAHKQQCTFRVEAERFLGSKRTLEAKCAFVNMFASVIPEETVKLLDHPSPSHLLRIRVREIEDTCPTTPASWEFPSLEIADEIQSFNMTLNDDIKISAVDAVSALCDLLGAKHTSVIWATILGWAPVKTEPGIDPESQNPVVSLRCSVCLAAMDITLRKSQDFSTSGHHLPKRQKRLPRYCNPHHAHRYYCPFRCGFPTSVLAVDTPLWQGLLSRLMSERGRNQTLCEGGDTSTEKMLDPEQSLARIRKILLSGLVPKKVELPVDIYDEEEYNGSQIRLL